MLQTVDEPTNPYDLLSQIMTFSITSIGIVVFDGKNYTTHHYGMNTSDMLVAAELWQRYAKGDYSNVREH